jgi:hypothetical protein
MCSGPMYLAEKPCKRGHRLRYISDNTCVECRDFTRKQWQEKNPEQYRATIERWRKANPEKVQASRRRRRENHERKVAKMAGVKTFVPVRPCKRGHSLRYVSNNACVACVVAASMGRWKALPPEVRKARTAARNKAAKAKKKDFKKP